MSHKNSYIALLSIKSGNPYLWVIDNHLQAISISFGFFALRGHWQQHRHIFLVFPIKWVFLKGDLFGQQRRALEKCSQ